MTQAEVISYFGDVLGKLWPKWKTNNAQVSAWAKELKYFDYSAVRRATEEHFTSQEGSYGRPKLYAIIAKARLYQPGKNQAKQSAADYEPDVFIQCVEHDEKPGYVFWFNAVRVEPKHRDNHDYVMSVAENMRSRFQACYGGTWIIIQQTNYDQMRKQRSVAIAMERRRLSEHKAVTNR